MWSTQTLTKLNAEKPAAKLSMEEIAAPIMEQLLTENGLQITLKILADALENLMEKRGPSVEGCLILETLRGLYKGYCRRHEEEEHKEKCEPRVRKRK